MHEYISSPGEALRRSAPQLIQHGFALQKPVPRGPDMLQSAGGPNLLLPLQKLAPTGVDGVYDPVGGKSFEEALKVVKWGAQILIIGFASGDIPKVRAGELLGGCEGMLVPAEVLRPLQCPMLQGEAPR